MQSSLQIIKSDAPEKWQKILSDLITEPKELVEILGLDSATRPASLSAMKQFPLKVPKPFVSRMRRQDWDDPLLRQVWPAVEETRDDPALTQDPLKESAYLREPGLLHKYQGRVLLTAAPHCGIHCRYCFRRHFDYAANTPGRTGWQAALDYIAGDDSISEVILSGGDPLALGDEMLGWLIARLDAIPHLQTLRVHSRMPIVIPQRITRQLLCLLAGSRLKPVMVVHCNHAAEIDQDVANTLSTMRANGITLLNQSIILKGVNDSSPVLKSLSEALFSHDVLPYYLHLPDAVRGTGHFRVDARQARAIVGELTAQLPGYLVPRLVQEIPGELSKTGLPALT